MNQQHRLDPCFQIGQMTLNDCLLSGQKNHCKPKDNMLGNDPQLNRCSKNTTSKCYNNCNRSNAIKSNYIPIFLWLGFTLLVSTANSVGHQQPPVINNQPGYEQLFQVSSGSDEVAKPFALECEASGDPEPKYYWKKNGVDFDYVAYDKRISQQPRRGTLIFQRPDVVDEGLYQCYAKNIHGTSVSNAVFLRRSELNSFPDDKQEEKRIIEGSPLTVDCNPPTGYPKPYIFWIIVSPSGSLRSINSSRITVDPEGRLHFSNVTRDDDLGDSWYACSATSSFRTEYKIGRRFRLSVDSAGAGGQTSHSPIKHYTSPPHVPAIRGQTLQLHCIFGGTPLPEITWRRKSGSIEDYRYVYTNFGKTLEIRNVSFSDQDTFECTASNGIGRQQTHAMMVVVKSAPYWIRAPDHQNAAEGESVSFHCEANGLPEPKLQWLVNGLPLERAPSNSRRKIEGNMMTIEQLTRTDTSVYQCNASNVHGYAFKNFYLNVLALPPTIEESPLPVTASVVTATVELRCRVFGAPQPEVRWLKNGVELTGGRFQVLPTGHLRITDVLVTDNGEYTCFARNKFGDARSSGRLEVKKKTKITHKPENFEIQAGKMAVFRCNAEADPSLNLEIIWSFNNKEIDFDANQRMIKTADNSLSISKAIELDSGTYTCIARTELDRDTADATLTVQDVPNPPKILGVQCFETSALIEWTPTGDRRAPILSYTIQHNTSFAPDVWDSSFSDIPAPDNTFRVLMSPWANYTFRVIARNKIGLSEPSRPSDACSTPTSIPHKNPENVRGAGRTPNDLTIYWTPMAPIDHNAPGFFYKVYWKREDVSESTWSYKVVNDWTASQLVVPGQPTFKPYRIKVEAHNNRGQADLGAIEVIGYSGQARPTEAPQNFVNVSAVGPTTAEFQWSPVSSDSLRGHFRGYKLQCWTAEESEQTPREMIVSWNVTRAELNILRPFSRNYVHVLAFNDMYNGPPSERLEILTPEGVPGPVAAFDALPMGKSALLLLWQRPLEVNGLLTGYRIYYEEVVGTQLMTKVERQPPVNELTTRLKLANLKPDTKYRISIHATTRAGLGEVFYVEKKTAADDSTAPGAPKLAISRLLPENGKVGVRVTWKPNIESGYPGSGFYVMYKRIGDSYFESTPTSDSLDPVTVEGLEPGETYHIKVVSVDGFYKTESHTEEVTMLRETGFLAEGSTSHMAKSDWFIGVICTIAVAIVCTVLICMVKRNRGGKYSVHEKEQRHGGEFDYRDEGGFNEYDHAPVEALRNVGSRTSLTSSLRHHDDQETESITDYGDDDSSKFGEDGSFIGQYGGRARAMPQSPSGVATFV